MHSESDRASAASISTSDSDMSITDFEAEYYGNWRHCYNELLSHITNSCIFSQPPPVLKSSQLHLLEDWRVNSTDHFRCKIQVEPEMFDNLVTLIMDDPVFSNQSNCPQLPVHIQLCIFLFHAGHYGNTTSPEDAAQWAGISVGGIEKCTDRIIIALLSLHDNAIHFPDAGDKEQAKIFVEKHTCEEWCNGFLLVDGTKFTLFQRPGLHGDTWFYKDGKYSIDCQVHHPVYAINWGQVIKFI
jgi:hypothetical protein